MIEPARRVSVANQNMRRKNSTALMREYVANELIFAVVGPLGSGTSEVAEALREFLKKQGYRTEILKARQVIKEWAAANGEKASLGKGLSETEALQNLGDAMRERTKDHAAVALALVEKIRASRAEQKGETLQAGRAVEPDGSKRAFILDSLRNPGEVGLLRNLYQEAFCLIGIVCEEETRRSRLREKFRDAGGDAIDELMHRDEKADQKHGQQVADTFHLSDFFIDNTPSRFLSGVGQHKRANPKWMVIEELGRLVDILTHTKVVRPRLNETAMFHAYGARMQSACLSRQVGAALVDSQGNVIATGTNEVPRAGGGLYGSVLIESFDDDLPSQEDHRCFVHGGFCRNTREQNDLVKEFLEKVTEFRGIPVTDDLLKRIRSTRVGQLIEFSRAVHAEMDALLSAARQGSSPKGTRMFVTTFPCHNCARHIVAAGVDEVQFIEPYLKSRALPLHGDAITTTRDAWVPPSAVLKSKPTETPQVLFHPFTGIAPRLYRKAFYKDRDLKDNLTGDMLKSFPPADGVGATESLRLSYAQVEADLASKASGATS